MGVPDQRTDLRRMGDAATTGLMRRRQNSSAAREAPPGAQDRAKPPLPELSGRTDKLRAG
jgi:hypothetical protein